MAKDFVATLGIGKGTWGHVARLIEQEEWGKIVLISNEFAQENFKPAKEVEWIMINTRTGFDVLKNTIKEKLASKDLAVSIISGSGKEHMALLAALKENNIEFEFVILTGDGTKRY
jgi:hypothetical protein